MNLSFNKNFFTQLESQLAVCTGAGRLGDIFLDSFKKTLVYYLEYNEFSGQFTLVAQNKLCPENSLWLNAKISGLKIDERTNLKGFKKEIKKICDGLQDIHQMPYVEASVLTVCQKISGLFIGFSDADEITNMSVATKLLSYYMSQQSSLAEKTNIKKDFLSKIENEISRSKKTKSSFGLVSFFIKAKNQGDSFFLKSLRKLLVQNMNFADHFFIGDNGNIIILKNYSERDDLVLWSYKIKEAVKELYFKLHASPSIDFGIGLSLYPEHGTSAEDLALLANKACEQSFKAMGQKICIAQRGVNFMKDYEPRI